MKKRKQPAAETRHNSMELKTALVQMDVMPGNPDVNVANMLARIEEAKANGDEVVVFPEMCVSGYLLGDDWHDATLVRDFESYNQVIIDATKDSDIVVIWGNVRTDETKTNEDGYLRKYNAVFTAQGGKLVGERYKTAMPNYGEFDDKRYFHSTAQLAYEEGRSIESYANPVEVTIRDMKIKIGAAICEDGWASGEGNDYPYDIMNMLSERGSQVLFNISCSPVKNGKNYRRNQIFGDVARRARLPLGYANNVGIQNNGKDLIPFDGASTLYNADGSLQVMNDNFEEDVVRGTLDVPLFSDRVTRRVERAIQAQDNLDRLIEEKRTEFENHRDRHFREARIFKPNINELGIDDAKRIERGPETKEEEIKNLYNMVLSGIKSYLGSIGMKKVVIGLSGGADSALVAKLMVNAVGAENVYGINMPTQYNSDTTKDFAFDLAKELGINYSVFPIQDSYEFTANQLENTKFIAMTRDTELDQVPVADQTLFRRVGSTKAETSFSDVEIEHAGYAGVELSTVNLENIQARKRGNEVLAGLASALGGVFTNNGNKTESATGYCTVDGDLAGALAPIGDLYKSEVYDMMHYLAKKSGDMPTMTAIAESLPSAELSADHDIDAGKGDPFDYYYHDKLFFQFIEMRKNPEDILRWYEAGELEAKLGVKNLPAAYCGTTEAFIKDVERIYRLFKGSIWKRVQGQPIVRVSRKGFGYDLRESMLQGPLYYTQGYQKTKERLLAA